MSSSTPLFTPIRIDQIFPALDGEGALAGEPCVFVRLYGCSRGCLFCDTPQDPASMRLLTTIEVAQEILTHYPEYRHVAITGGEPLEQPEAVSDLVELLHGQGKLVILHTALRVGEIEYHNRDQSSCSWERQIDYVVYSPKDLGENNLWSDYGNTPVSHAIEWADYFSTPCNRGCNLKLLVRSPLGLLIELGRLRSSLDLEADRRYASSLPENFEVTLQAITPLNDMSSPQWIFTMWSTLPDIAKKVAINIEAIRQEHNIRVKILPQIQAMTMQRHMRGI